MLVAKFVGHEDTINKIDKDLIGLNSELISLLPLPGTLAGNEKTLSMIIGFDSFDLDTIAYTVSVYLAKIFPINYMIIYKKLINSGKCSITVDSYVEIYYIPQKLHIDHLEIRFLLNTTANRTSSKLKINIESDDAGIVRESGLIRVTNSENDESLSKFNIMIEEKKYNTDTISLETGGNFTRMQLFSLINLVLDSSNNSLHLVDRKALGIDEIVDDLFFLQQDHLSYNRSLSTVSTDCIVDINISIYGRKLVDIE